MEVRFRIATAEDAPALQEALEQLSADLGDTHRGTEADLGDLFGVGLGQLPARDHQAVSSPTRTCPPMAAPMVINGIW
jgi:hypothetical protein